MHSGHSSVPFSDGGSCFSKLNTGIENFISYLTDDCIPQLEQAGMQTCAEKLQSHLDKFDENCQIPYAAERMEPEELKQTYDQTSAAVARMCGLLYKNVNKHCSFSEHHDFMQGLLDATHDFNRLSQPTLRSLGLEYHEFDSLALELESKLGHINAPQPEQTHAEKACRRRRLPKDPEKIEEALHACVETAVQLRPMINNEKKQEKLDRIVGDVRSILSNLPEGDDDVSKGRRTSALVSASAKILKVSKWIRKVDLLEPQQSESTKREILRNFDTLASLSRGQENGRA